MYLALGLLDGQDELGHLFKVLIDRVVDRGRARHVEIGDRVRELIVDVVADQVDNVRDTVLFFSQVNVRDFGISWSKKWSKYE
jgi:hypothetical protein